MSKYSRSTQQGDILPYGTPVNAVAASGVVTFDGTPFVRVHYENANGTITITDIPVADEHLVIGSQTFHFKATRTTTGEIAINADNTVQAENIVSAITSDLTTVEATNIAGVVSLLSTLEGTLGNSTIFTTNATGIAVNGSGTLENGIDDVREYITIGIDDFEFVTLRSGAGSFQVTVNANNTTQGDNLVAALADSDIVDASNNAGTVTIISKIKGIIGNSYILSEHATGTAVSSVTNGKLDGGVNGTPGSINEMCANENFIYRAINNNTIADANWRRIATGESF